jgi:hypothetical protein
LQLYGDSALPIQLRARSSRWFMRSKLLAFMSTRQGFKVMNSSSGTAVKLSDSVLLSPYARSSWHATAVLQR